MLKIETLKLCLGQIPQLQLTENDVTTELTSKIFKMKKVFFDGETAYVFTGRYYQKISKKDLQYLIRSMLDVNSRFKLKSSQVNEVINRLSHDIDLQINMAEKLFENRHLLNLKNGVYDINTGKLSKDRKGTVFDYILDFDYLNDCTIKNAPYFYNFICTSLGEENMECLLRSVGYCISSLTDAKKIFLLVGKSNSGKSTFLKFLTTAVNSELISHVSFNKMADEKYIIQYLGKRMNISFDNSSKPMNDEDIFKSIASNETVTGRDLYESPVSFRPTLKLIFASNYTFNFKRPDEAIYRRLVIIPFERSIPPENQTKNLEQLLIKEKDVIFSLAVNSIRPLINDNYDFKMSEKGQSYINGCISMLHSAEDFLEDRTVIDKSGQVPSVTLHNLYIEWCKDNAITPICRNEFLEHVTAFSPDILRCKIGSSDKRLWGFKGIRLKTANELLITSPKESDKND